MEATLDEYQLKYYHEPLTMDKAILLFAVAGAGKTHTTLAKVIKIIKEGVSPKSILLTSFTNLSARELQTRYKDNINGISNEKPHISTLHGLGRAILRRSGIHLYPITEWGAILRIRDTITEKLPSFAKMFKSEQTALARSVHQTYSKLRNNSLIYYHSLESDLQKINLSHEVLTSAQLKSVIIGYEKLKESQNTMDYDDMIWRPNSLFRENYNQTRALVQDIDYYFIDEAQDLSQSQYDIIVNCSQHKSLTLVGDICQSIYGFRDATPQNFSRDYLSKFYNSITELTLENNYRSTPAIIKVSNYVREISNDPIEAKANRPHQDGSVKIVQASNNVTEGKYITDQIKQLLLTFEPKDIVVICRTNRYIKSVLEPAFINANLLYQIVGGNNGKKLLDKPLSQFFLDCITYICNDKDHYALVNVLSKVKGVGASNLPSILKELNDNNLTTKADEVRDIIERLATIRAKALKKVYDVVSEIAQLSRNYCLQSVDLTEKNLDTISLSLSNYISLQMDNGITDPTEILSSMLTEVQVFEDEQEHKAIKLATIHSQKGLESPVVFCAGFNAQTPSGYMSDKDESYCLYVQVSRARDKLYIVDSKMYLTRNGKVVDNYKNPYVSKLFNLIQQRRQND